MRDSAGAGVVKVKTWRDSPARNERQMKRTQNVLAAALVLAFATVALAGCTGSTHNDAKQNNDTSAQKSDKATQYTCSMHPEVVQDKPGDCPKCGMKLVEKK